MKPLRGTCRYCGRPIIWAVTTAGKRIPLNPDPDPVGRIILNSGEAIVIATGMKPRPEQLRYSSHFGSCTPYERRGAAMSAAR